MEEFSRESPLNTYLRGEFRSDELAIEAVRENATKALETLQAFGKSGIWPYEIEDNKKPTYDESEKASISTSSMILFSMAVAMGIVKSQSLAPCIAPEDIARTTNEERQRRRESIIADLTALHNRALEQVKDRRDRPGDRNTPEAERICLSRTYGLNDPFTLLWLIELLGGCKGTPELDDWYERIKSAAEAEARWVIKTLDRPSLRTAGALNHVFPLLRFIQIWSVLGLEFNDEERNVLIQDVRNRLNSHLSYFSIPNSSYDAAELAFAMEALLILNPDAIENATVDRWKEVLAESQERTPYWRPLRPFIATPQGMGLLPLSVEIANSLVRSSEMLDKRDRLGSHRLSTIKLLRTYTDWLSSRIVKGKADGKEFFGWHSEHADDPNKIHTWETSQVLIYLLQYKCLLEKYRAQKSIEAMNLSVVRPETITLEGDWNMFQSSEPLAGLPDSEYAVYGRIDQSFIQPYGRSDSAYSMLLYGPQGTGKTTMARQIAKRLNVQFISLSPSDFIVGGGGMVEAQAKSIFDVLGAQMTGVILLDEIDRLILDRTSDAYFKQSDLFQFMTPSMLTKLQQLHDRRRTIFIIATNFAENIDAAIKRSGRIDYQYLILPPDLLARTNLLRQHVGKYASEIAVDEVALEQSAKSLVLAVPKEIKNAVRDAAQASTNESGRSKAFWEALRERSARPKTIRMSSYGNRLQQKGAAEPLLTEYLLLMYLLVQSGSDEGGVESVLWRPVRDHIHSADDLGKWVKDEDVCQRLRSMIFGTQQ